MDTKDWMVMITAAIWVLGNWCPLGYVIVTKHFPMPLITGISLLMGGLLINNDWMQAASFNGWVWTRLFYKHTKEHKLGLTICARPQADYVP